jgi:hypothetical protein
MAFSFNIPAKGGEPMQTLFVSPAYSDSKRIDLCEDSFEYLDAAWSMHPGFSVHSQVTYEDIMKFVLDYRQFLWATKVQGQACLVHLVLLRDFHIRHGVTDPVFCDLCHKWYMLEVQRDRLVRAGTLPKPESIDLYLN